MRILTLKILVFILPVISYSQGVTLPPILSQQIGEPFIFQINTDSGTGDFFKLPLKSTGTYDFEVNWGDGNSSFITSWDDVDTTHLYTLGGAYTITITGICTAWYFNNSGDKDKLTSITSFGEVGLNDIASGFYGCTKATGPIPAFPETLTTIGFNAFRFSTFTSIDLTGINIIQNAAYYICNKMTGDLIIPSTITTLGNDIFQSGTFDGDLIINSPIASIPGSVFRGMPNLTNIYFNNSSLAEIQAFCFYQTQISGNVYIQVSTAPIIGTNGFAVTLGGVIHVPVEATGYDIAPWTSYTIVYDL